MTATRVYSAGTTSVAGLVFVPKLSNVAAILLI